MLNQAPSSAERRAARIPVMEIFGPTVQGEGMVIGRKTRFVRTAGCDYRCSWCDSAFTWDGTGKDDIRLLSPDDIVQELTALDGSVPDHVTLSGGNPALLPQLGALIGALRAAGAVVALETQGSKWQDWFLEIDELTISPKPPSSGMTTDWAALERIVARLSQGGRHFSLKVVIFDEADLMYAADVRRRFAGIPFYLQAGNDRLDEHDRKLLLPHLLERYEWLVDRAVADPGLRDVYVLPQLHTWIWGNKKGV